MVRKFPSLSHDLLKFRGSIHYCGLVMQAFVNGLIAQAVLGDIETHSGVASKWGAFVAAMSSLLIAGGASG